MEGQLILFFMSLVGFIHFFSEYLLPQLIKLIGVIHLLISEIKKFF